MALKPVQDPSLLAALNAPETPAAASPKPVTDPALLAQLNGAPAEPRLGDELPQVPDPTAPAPAPAEEPSVWEKFKSGITEDPIMQMWGHGLSTAAQGAPEVAMDMIGNTGVQIAGGLGGLMLGQNDNDAANFSRDFAEENSMRPQGANAKELTGALGEAFQPYQNIKEKLGDTTLEATGSPLAAAGADVLPDLGLALLGGEGAAAGTADVAKTALKADRVVNPKVGDLRAADIRLRPSDVRAMTPGAKKVPGEFRERFADAPELKKDMTLHNQQRFTDINAKDLGVASLDEASLAKAKEAPAAVYDMAEKVIAENPKGVSPEFQDVFREAASSARLPQDKNYSVTRVIGALRRRAAKRIQNDQVATEEAGYADRDLAERLEDQFGKELEAAGEPQLLQQYQDARQQFAKIHDVESTTRAGQIDAGKVYNLKQRGAQLSGALKLTADAAEHAPNVTKHSLTTAARAGGEVEGSKAGMMKSGIKAVLRKVPGMDVGSEGFQRSLGKADEARTSYYGRDPGVAPARGPEQGGLDLREALQLEAPPGEVGAPARSPRPFGPQAEAFGNEFEFQAPPGEVGVPPPAQISLQDLLGLGEPLNLQKSAGRVGKPKRKP